MDYLFKDSNTVPILNTETYQCDNQDEAVAMKKVRLEQYFE